MHPIVKKICTIEALVCMVTVYMIGMTCFYLLANYKVKSRDKDVKIIEPGTQFEPFIAKLEGITQVGYLTNKDMSEEKNDGTFLQAQYMLAPTILKLNEEHPKLNVLDYTSPVYTVFTLRSLRSAPIASSPYGQVLAERKE